MEPNESYDRKKARSSINHSILSEVNYLGEQIISVCSAFRADLGVKIQRSKLSSQFLRIFIFAIHISSIFL